MSQRYIGGLIYNPPGGFSGYFDGSGDYLTSPNIAFASNNFTIEGWFFPTTIANNTNFWGMNNGSGSTPKLVMYVNGSGSLVVDLGSAGTTQFPLSVSASAVIRVNAWNHIAVVRSGTGANQFVLYINGVSVSSGQLGTNISSITATFNIGYVGESYGQTFSGYISNFRIVNGTAVYTAAFDPPVGPLQAITNTSLLTCAYPTFRDGSSNNFTITVNGNTAVSTQNPFPQTQLPNPALGNQGNGVYSMSQYQALRSQNLWPAIDPWFDYVTLMLHGNGTNGAQNNTFLDSSTNNFTITRNGNTTQGTFTPYGSNWGNYFVDSSSSFLSIASSSIVNFGTSDFTAEAWVNLNTLDTSIDTIISNYNNGSNGGLGWYINRGTNGGIQVYSGNSLVVSASSAVTAGTWNHIAICRASGTTRIFVNGAIAASASDSSNYGADNSATGIGGTPPGSGAGAYLPGYLSNVRVVKNTALYTSAFTPSTAPLTAITNTSLLTCQSNRFIDNSSNNFTITRNGDVSVQRFSPFNPTTPYAAGTIGGSGYFDGSGDWLETASNAAMAVGTGDFTLECWVYATATPSDVGIYEGRDPASSNGITLTALDATTIRIFSGSALVTASGVNYIGTWCHLAVTRISGTTTLYINGVSAGTSATSYNGTRNTAIIGAGVYSSSPTPNKFFPGYISNFRLVKGTAVYTGNFTPPASPVAAVTNTSLLLNFTNGGIIDNAMMSDFETVGNTQVSTTQFKFGGASIYFDGSGDYLFTPISPNLNMGTGDWTIEMWVYVSSRTTNYPLVFGNNRGSYTTDAVALTNSNADSASYNDKFVFAWNNGGFSSPSAGTSQLLVANVTNATATWYHFAVVRNGTSIRMYRNGTEIASATISAASTFNWGFNGTLLGGGNWDGAQSEFNGYLDDVRVTRGYARYTANFTPQRSQWQDQ